MIYHLKSMLQQKDFLKLSYKSNFIYIIISAQKKSFTETVKSQEIHSQQQSISQKNTKFHFQNQQQKQNITSKTQIMNQRATHFVLGSTSNNYGSMYKKDYPPKQGIKNDAQGKNPFRSSSLNQNDKGNFATTNKDMYKVWDNIDKVKLDDNKLHQLRKHHFQLGAYDSTKNQTTNNLYHNLKNLSSDASKNQEESKNKMRGHNHNFMEQKNTNYLSTYNNQYKGISGDLSGPAKSNYTENAIVLGNNRLPMVTTNLSSFTAKSPQAPLYSKSGNELMELQLGSKDREPMETINQLYHNKKQIVKTSLPQSTMKELRNTHFNLGAANVNYDTQSNKYNKMHSTLKNTNNPLTFQIPTYQAGTWNDKNAKFNGSTTNKRDLPQREVKNFQKHVTQTRSGIDLGGQTGNYISEFKSNYHKHKEGDSYKPSTLNKDNISIGDNSKGLYETQHKSKYKNVDISQARVDIDIKALNTTDHFQIGGNSKDAILTIYQDQFRKDVENKSRIFKKNN